jgi:hypothetical protein
MHKQTKGKVRRASRPPSQTIFDGFWGLVVLFVVFYICIKTPILNVINEYVLCPIRDVISPKHL